MKPFLRILLPAAVCGLLLGACTQRQTTLKFMSYNIRNGRGIDNVQDLGRVAEIDRKSTRLNSSHYQQSRMPSSA